MTSKGFVALLAWTGGILTACTIYALMAQLPPFDIIVISLAATSFMLTTTLRIYD